MDILKDDQLKRTRSDAIASEMPHPLTRKTADEDQLPRRRSKSGDSYTLSKLLTTATSSKDKGQEVVIIRDGGITEPDDVGMACGGVANPDKRYQQCNGHGTDLGNLHRRIKLDVAPTRMSLVKSKSSEDICSSSHPVPPTTNDVDHGISSPDSQGTEFCELNYLEPEDLDTGGDYTVIFDDDTEDLYLSDEEQVEDRSVEIRDLVPLDSPRLSADLGGSGKSLGSISPPRPTAILIQVFRQRLESIMINDVDYPPGLFFVQ